MTSEAVGYLRTPEAIRERSENVLAAGLTGSLDHFDVTPERIPDVARRVAAVTRARFPNLYVPLHSRFQHFDRIRLNKLADLLSGASPDERVRTCFDLVVTSVLLDAGAGAKWRYQDPVSGEEISRSEGLAAASFDMFVDGTFSHDRERPLQATKEGLVGLNASKLAAGFQASTDNPLVGLEGRATLMNQLGDALTGSRVGNLYDDLKRRCEHGVLEARTILTAILEAFSSIWPGRLALDGAPLGDVWRHPRAGGEGPSAGLAPLHKLSQWLAYSLIDILQVSGTRIIELDALTGLAEYRNGGLFIDGGVLVPKHDAVTRDAHVPDSEVVVEWRALTVALLDRTATAVRDELGVDADEMPLAKVLEGGTWHMGRVLARERRTDGSPPIRVESDGTVF